MHEVTAQSLEWSIVERVKAQERFTKRVATVAWGVTMAMLLVFAGVTAQHMAQTMRMVRVGAAPWSELILAVVPLIAAVGAVSVLVAALATIALMVQSRQASLAEIRWRLASLERALGADAPHDS